jgi:hypothetical protein
MKKLTLRSTPDDSGRFSVSDHDATSIVGPYGYGTQDATLIVDGTEYDGTVTFGNISNWATVPAFDVSGQTCADCGFVGHSTSTPSGRLCDDCLDHYEDSSY